ncbi:probable glutamate receptor [Ctenocephalides felis]|uniref:probable glutamate receptor n=1 Tax=Ctenocephalides felis TaxID=7515 RepID=UPI000E6E3184|nr:probable glutamate receptor [Ctenocephalides felis]
MIIILNEEQQNESTVLEHQLFEDFPNIIVITKSSQNSYKLSTTKYGGKYNHTEELYLNMWYNASFRSDRHLFSNKISDMEGRNLKIVTFNYKPYAIWTRVESGGNAGYLEEGPESYGTVSIDGTELRACLEFCNKHNCTISLIGVDEEEWGEIYENGTGIGILGTLSEGKVDLGVGSVYSWYHEYEFLDLSLPMVRTGITVIAPIPKLRPGWSIPIRPFSSKLWLGLIVSIAVSVIVSYISDKFKNTPYTSIENETIFIIRYLLLQPPPDADSLKYNRFIVSGILLLALMLSNAYAGGLSSIMTIPVHDPPIDSVKDLSSKNMEWGANSDAWLYSLVAAEEPELIHLRSMFRKLNDDQLIKRQRSGDFAFSVERLPSDHFAVGDYIKEEYIDRLRLMKEDIYWEQCVAMMPKSSPFLDSYNMHILRILETGLPAFWEFKVSIKYLNNKVQLGILLSNTMHDHSGPVKLRPDHISGALVAWTLGMIISTAIFVCELLIKRLGNKELYLNTERE